MVADSEWEPIETPVPESHLLAEGLSPSFVKYMGNWKGFVDDGSGAVDERRASSTRKASGVRKELGDVMNQKKSSFKKAE